MGERQADVETVGAVIQLPRMVEVQGKAGRGVGRQGGRAVEADAEAVMVIINDAQAGHDDALHDGDRLEFMVSIQGG